MYYIVLSCGVSARFSMFLRELIRRRRRLGLLVLELRRVRRCTYPSADSDGEDGEFGQDAFGGGDQFTGVGYV